MYLTIKRGFDVIVSLVLIVMLAPLFIVFYFIVKLDSPGPVFFKQKRVGLYKKHFYILKYRSMRIDTPSNVPTHKLKDATGHITRVGKLLRVTSIDELPQLFNILKGNMSFVGPRPALWNQYDLIEERDKYGANDVPVGLTGWAQVNGRDELPIEVKAKYDGFYVQNRSLLFDLKCIFRTFSAVFAGSGVVEGGVK